MSARPGFDQIQRALLGHTQRGTIFDLFDNSESGRILAAALAASDGREAAHVLDLILERKFRRTDPRMYRILRAAVGLDFEYLASSQERLRALARETGADYRNMLLRVAPGLTDLSQQVARWSGSLNAGQIDPSGGDTRINMRVVSPETAERMVVSHQESNDLSEPTMAIYTQIPTKVTVNRELFAGQILIGGSEALVIDINITRIVEITRYQLAIERDEHGRFAIMHKVAQASFFPIIRWDDLANIREVRIRTRIDNELQVSALVTPRTGRDTKAEYYSPTPAGTRNVIPAFSLAKREKYTIDWVQHENP